LDAEPTRSSVGGIWGLGNTGHLLQRKEVSETSFTLGPCFEGCLLKFAKQRERKGERANAVFGKERQITGLLACKDVVLYSDFKGKNGADSKPQKKNVQGNSNCPKERKGGNNYRNCRTPQVQEI